MRVVGYHSESAVGEDGDSEDLLAVGSVSTVEVGVEVEGEVVPAHFQTERNLETVVGSFPHREPRREDEGAIGLAAVPHLKQTCKWYIPSES